MISAAFLAAAIFMQVQSVAPPKRLSADPPIAIESDTKTVSPLVVTPRDKPEERVKILPNELVCHEETPAGTRFPVKVCAKAIDFKERTREQQDLLREWQKTPIATKQ